MKQIFWLFATLAFTASAHAVTINDHAASPSPSASQAHVAEGESEILRLIKAKEEAIKASSKQIELHRLTIVKLRKEIAGIENDRQKAKQAGDLDAGKKYGEMIGKLKMNIQEEDRKIAFLKTMIEHEQKEIRKLQSQLEQKKQQEQKALTPPKPGAGVSELKPNLGTGRATIKPR